MNKKEKIRLLIKFFAIIWIFTSTVMLTWTLLRGWTLPSHIVTISLNSHGEMLYEIPLTMFLLSMFIIYCIIKLREIRNETE